MALLRPQEFNSQPQYPPQIARSNPLAAGLIDAILPIGGRMVSIGPNNRFDNFTNTNAPTVGYGNSTGALSAGLSYNYTAASNQYSSRNSSPVTQVKEITLLAVWSTSVVASTGAIFSYGNSGSNNPFIYIGASATNNPYFRAQDNTPTNQAVTGSSAKLAINQLHVTIGTRSQSNNFHRLYVDGLLDAASTTATTLGTYTQSDRTAVGVLLRSTTAVAQNGRVFLCLAWNRALSPSEVASISANPWQVFEQAPRRLWVSAPAGGTVTAQQLLMMLGVS